jgi:hypothetical protein
VSPVSGAADLERKNAYWIEFGKSEERERVIKLLDESLAYDEPDIIERDRLIALIKGDNK